MFDWCKVLLAKLISFGPGQSHDIFRRKPNKILAMHLACLDKKEKMTMRQARAIVLEVYPEAKFQPIDNKVATIFAGKEILCGWHWTEEDCWKEAAMRITGDSAFANRW